MTTPSVAEAPLGINTRFASPPQPVEDRRARRFMLQAVARELLPGERVSACMRHICKQPGKVARAEVWYSPRAERSHFKGLAVCGSVWHDPVCASKITERRREELAKGIGKWKGSIFMGTFTLQHTRDDRLVELRDYLKDAYRGVKSGKWWIGFERRFSVVGSVNGFESTVSRFNGWHPHLHVLFFSETSPDELDTEKAEAELSRKFSAILEKRGRYVSGVYGVRVESAVDAQSDGDQALKKYISKWGLDSELAKSPVKNARRENGIEHFSPFQLLEVYASGKKWAGGLFQEYAKAMKGARQLRYSPGLRELLGLDAEEQSDEELAQEIVDIGDKLLAALSWSQWRVILANDARAELLKVADSGDVYQVNAFLSLLGIKNLVGGVFEEKT